MKTIKEIFDVELGEMFDIITNEKDKRVWKSCYFDENGKLSLSQTNHNYELYHAFERNVLEKLITGEYRIIKRTQELLNEKDKEFLTTIVNYFGRDNIVSIRKHLYGFAHRDAIIICFTHSDLDMCIPLFQSEDPFPIEMFNTLEADHEYTLDDLRIY